MQITGYRNLYQCVEQLRKEVYDCDKEEHEKMLLKVTLLFHTAVSSACCIASDFIDAFDRIFKTEIVAV